MTHASFDFSNLVEFDALAQSIAARLNCSLSLISIADGDTLQAMGHSGHEPDIAQRTVAARDTICIHTMRAAQPLKIADVRADPKFRDAPTVEALNVGAYLGVPLRMDGGNVIGAMCAISSAPRIWQEAEIDYLLAVADLAESKIERLTLRYEHGALSRALAENDAILSTLAETRGKAVTVHNADGDLVFANATLRTDLHLSFQELLALPRAAQQLVAQGAHAGAVEVNVPGRPTHALFAHVFAVKDGLTLAEWHRDT
ncbi:GAF domain-containing protein [uncultured Tateyamaria sp.]|uniref:GAF domain-containing protein n=1 Tax=uncultured Tateyamaria sp. TaxID=455651 RepID=UPI00261A2136|nr:GAF domain-containing protein [uncultured Tateyamaria sp.]